MVTGLITRCNEDVVVVWPVPRIWISRVWPVVEEGVGKYIKKTPHQIGTPEDIRVDLESEDGDNLLLMLRAGKYAGFATYKIIEFESEKMACFAMIYADENAAGLESLKRGIELARGLFANAGCTRASFFTARRGFRRLAPRLGFSERIVEYTMEVG